jgi:hypothetical protein
MKQKTVKYAISGVLTGAVNGLFGAGGGMVLVPLLTRWCRMEDKAAFASALAVVFPICLVSLVVYGQHGAIDWQLALPYLLGGLGGGLLGGLLFRRVSATALRNAFALILLGGGIRLLCS